jgi:hypothetical protein
MNQNPASAASDLSANPDASDQVMDEGQEISDNASFTSTAPAVNMPDGQIREGVPIFDVRGETVGNVAAFNEQEGYLVVRAGWLFAQDTRLPLDSIGDRGASGLYLKQTRDELAQQYGGSTDQA